MVPAPEVPLVTAAPMVPVWHRVLEVRPETADTVTLTVGPLDQALEPAVPGQFHMLYAVGVGEVPVSVSSVEADRLGFTVRDVGAVTGALVRLPVGAVIGVRGPYGVGWDLGAVAGRDVVVVAGGLGLAPLRQAVRELLGGRHRQRRLSVLVGARTPRDLCFADELDLWGRRDEVRVGVTVDAADRHWWGSVGTVTTLLRGVVVDPAATSALVCGPEVMMRATVRRLTGDGVPVPAVQLSMERNMRCAVAWCGHCQFGPHLLCRDGPVLGADRVEPLLGVREL